ncbi:hypothetical protein DXG01_010423, partial [Tephrocybe rancida]
MTLSDHEKEVLTALSNTIGSLPLLPPSLDSLDVFPGQLLPPPPSSIDASSSTVPSPAKRPHDDNKPNPFIDLEVEEDLQENADILDDTEGDNEFDDFIDDCEIPSDEEPPTVHLEDENKDNNDEELFPDKDAYPDNQYPLTAGAISHKALASHNDMEQWRSLLDRAYEQAREHQPAYQRLSLESFDDGLKPLPPALMYKVRVKDGYEETAAMVLATKLLTGGTHTAPSIKSIIGRVSCPGWIFIESNGADASNLCANVSDIYPRHIYPIVEDLHQYLHEPFVAPKE